MKIVFVLLLTMTFSLAESLSEISGLIQDHEYARAEVDLKAGLQNHPNSALGWYYLAQDEYFLHNFVAARGALARAEAIDQRLTFVRDPQEFYRLQARLSPVTSLGSVPPQAYPRVSSPGFNWLSILFWIIVVVAGLALVSALLAAFRRQTTTYVGGNFGNPAPPPNTPPQYPPSYPTPGPGVGTFLGGMAAGALVDELFRPRTEIIEEQVIVDPEDRGLDRPNDPLPFDPGNTNQDWSSNDNSGGFDSGNASDNTSNW